MMMNRVREVKALPGYKLDIVFVMGYTVFSIAIRIVITSVCLAFGRKASLTRSLPIMVR